MNPSESIDCPFREAPVVKQLGHYLPPTVIACPMCGRCDIGADRFYPLVELVDERVHALGRPLKVAVMGCEVNGPGECRDADLGLCFGRERVAFFQHGRHVKTVPYDETMATFDRLLRSSW